MQCAFIVSVPIQNNEMPTRDNSWCRPFVPVGGLKAEVHTVGNINWFLLNTNLDPNDKNSFTTRIGFSQKFLAWLNYFTGVKVGSETYFLASGRADTLGTNEFSLFKYENGVYKDRKVEVDEQVVKANVAKWQESNYCIAIRCDKYVPQLLTLANLLAESGHIAKCNGGSISLNFLVSDIDTDAIELHGKKWINAQIAGNYLPASKLKAQGIDGAESFIELRKLGLPFDLVDPTSVDEYLFEADIIPLKEGSDKVLASNIAFNVEGVATDKPKGTWNNNQQTVAAFDPYTQIEAVIKGFNNPELRAIVQQCYPRLNTDQALLTVCLSAIRATGVSFDDIASLDHYQITDAKSIINHESLLTTNGKVEVKPEEKKSNPYLDYTPINIPETMRFVYADMMLELEGSFGKANFTKWIKKILPIDTSEANDKQVSQLCHYVDALTRIIKADNESVNGYKLSKPVLSLSIAELDKELETVGIDATLPI